MFRFFTVIGLILGLSFLTYGKTSVLGPVAYKAHQTTDRMLDAITELEEPN